MKLTEHQKHWLVATVGAAPREGRIFKRQVVRDRLRCSAEEGTEAAIALQKEGLVVLLPDDEAILTDEGRRVAESLVSHTGTDAAA